MAHSVSPSVIDRVAAVVKLYGVEAVEYFHKITTLKPESRPYVFALLMQAVSRLGLSAILVLFVYVFVRKVVYGDPRAVRSILQQDIASTKFLHSDLGTRAMLSIGKRQSHTREKYDIYQAGEEYGDPKDEELSIAEDLRLVGSKVDPKKLNKLFQAMRSVGKPLDDRQMTVCPPRDFSKNDG